MNKKSADTADDALHRVIDLINDEEIIVFTSDEAKALQEMAVVWGQLKAVVSLGGTLGKGMKWFVLFVGAWIAFKAGVLDWIREGLDK